MTQTLDQLSAAATEGECPCCGAPCEVTTTPACDFQWKDKYGIYRRTYHHATSSYAYRTGQLVAVADDAVERVARAILKAHAFDTTGSDLIDQVEGQTWHDWIPEAKAAIAAMKDTQP